MKLVIYIQLYCVCFVAASHGQTTKKLHYAVFTAGPEGAFDSSGSIPAIEIAEEQVASSSVLDGYLLNHTSVEDTYVS